MSVAIGTKLGPYEITSPIGAGGMGEVYCTRDMKLKRDVDPDAKPKTNRYADVTSDYSDLKVFRTSVRKARQPGTTAANPAVKIRSSETVVRTSGSNERA